DADSIIWHEWYFGDGSQKSILKNPTHTYRRFGWRTVKHKAYSKLGCVDSLAKQLYVAGPVPEFEFKDNAWWNFLDSATIYVGDTLELKNTSHDPMHSPQFILDWGDNYTTATTDINEVFKHAYTRDGIYYPNLFMEDTLDQTTERCFSYFPTGDSTWTPSRDIVVFVRPDTTNSVSQLIPFASVFPNPNTGSFNITTLANNRILAIDLTNVFGQKIAFHVKKIGDNRVEVDANFLNTGNYFLILNTEQGTIRKKITIVN
ncbi:MAG: PKD repeat protein, partial [Bacteroidia bacterium]